jgi:hypothetical protein
MSLTTSPLPTVTLDDASVRDLVNAAFQGDAHSRNLVYLLLHEPFGHVQGAQFLAVVKRLRLLRKATMVHAEEYHRRVPEIRYVPEGASTRRPRTSMRSTRGGFA